MNSRQKNKLAMYKKVRKVCSQYNDKWTKFGAFSNVYSEIDALVTQLELLGPEQQELTDGLVTQKQKLKLVAAEEALLVSQLLMAYADTAGNPALMQRVKYRPTALRRASTRDFLDACANIRKAANSVLAELKDFGLTGKDIAALDVAVKQYSEAASEPTDAIAMRAETTEDIEEVFDKVDKLFENRLDYLMVVFKVTASDFYGLYKRSRVVVNRKHNYRRKSADEATPLRDISDAPPPPPPPIEDNANEADKGKSEAS